MTTGQLTRDEKFTKSRWESCWWSSSPLLHFHRGILLFLLYVPSCPVLATSRSRRTGRFRGFLFSQGVVGKSRGASGRKGVTDTLSTRSGNSFRVQKPAGTSFSWYIWRGSSSPLAELCMPNWILEERRT